MRTADQSLPEVSVVVPVYREEETIPALVEQVSGHLERCGATHEILLIDDGSPGGTWDSIVAVSRRFPQVRGIRLSRNFGKEAALCAGLEQARGRAVITMDGDLQHPPSAIPEMLRRWRAGEAVIVDGVKLEPSRPRSWAFYAVFRTLSGVDLDRASDFKLLDRQAVEAWRSMGDRNLFFRGMAHWVGFRRSQVTFEVAERGAGRSRWSIVRLMRLAAHAVVAFSSAPLQVATAMGMAFFLFALLLGAETLFLKLSGQAVSGFATVILLLLIIGSLVLLSLGVIGQYIAAIYDEVKGRPRYLVSQTVGGARPLPAAPPPEPAEPAAPPPPDRPEPEPEPPSDGPVAAAAGPEVAPDLPAAPDAPGAGLTRKELALLGARLAAVLAGLALCTVAMLSYIPHKEGRPLALSLGAAALLLGFGLGLPSPERLRMPAALALPAGTPARTLTLGLAAVMLTATALFLFGADPPLQGPGWAVHLAALACLVAAFWPFRGERDGTPVAWWEWAALLAILAVGAALRLHRLTWQPYGAWYDEAQNVLEAGKILASSSHRPVFVAELSQMPALFFYLIAVFVKLVGASVLAARGAATAAGLAALVAVWALGRRLFTPTVGLFAAALLAVCRWHLAFSRFGMAMIFTTLVVPLVLWLFHRSQQRGSARDAVLAGVAMGLGIQLYYALLAVPALLVAYAAHRALTRRRQLLLPVALTALTLVSGALTYAPLMQYARANREAYTERMRTASAFNVVSLRELAGVFLTPGPRRTEAVGILERSAAKHAAMFHLAGDSNGRHNLPGVPMLERAPGVLFVVGLLWCLARCWRPREALLLIWFAAMMAAGILSLEFEAPQGARTLGVTSVLALLAALPLARLWNGFPAPRRGRWIGRITALALLYAAFAEARHTFFDEQLWDPAAFAFWSAQETKIGQLAAAAGKRADLYVPEPLMGGPTQTLVSGGTFSAQAFDEGRDLPLPGGRDAIVVLQGNQDTVTDELRRFYPHATVEPFGPPNPDGSEAAPILQVVRVPASDVAALRGWQVEAGSLRRSVSEAEWRWDEWSAAPPFQAKVAGYLRVEQPGRHELELESPAGASLRIDEAPVLAAPGRVALHLAACLHAVALTLDVRAKGSVSRLRWRTPSGADAPIEPAALFLPRLHTGGLLGRYYPGAACAGEPKLEKVDARIGFYFHFLPLPRPFSICWSGSLRAPEGGRYLLGTNSVDGSVLRLDGRAVVTNPGGGYVEAPVELAAGWHPVEVQYHAVGDYSQVYLSWTPPGKEHGVVPAADLRPEPPRVLER